jgi:hypothetical protein
VLKLENGAESAKPAAENHHSMPIRHSAGPSILLDVLTV